jgi:hypothetical protein
VIQQQEYNMPAVHRVGDIDSGGDSAQTGAEGVFVNGGPTLGGGVADTLGVDNIVGLSDEDARAILSGYSAELAEGNDPEINEQLESFGGGSPNGVSPTTGESGVIPAPGSDAAGVGSDDGTPPIETTKPVTEWLNFLPHVSDSIKDEVWDKLYDLAKNKIKRPIRITCGYRSPAYNTRVGGAKKSQHMEGNAVDILWDTTNVQVRIDFIQQAINAGFTGIGCYSNFVHLDIGPKRHWGPNGSFTGQIQQYKPILENNGYTF